MFTVENKTTGEVVNFETLGAAEMFTTCFENGDEFYINGVRYEIVEGFPEVSTADEMTDEEIEMLFLIDSDGRGEGQL